MKRLWHHLRGSRPLFLCTLLVGLAFSLNSVILPHVSGGLVDRVMAAPALHPGLFVPFLAVSLFQLTLSTGNTYLVNRLTRRQKQLLRQRAFDGFSRSERYGREETAALTSFINNDVPSLAEQYFLGVIDIANCAGLVIFSSASLLAVHWLLAFIVIGVSLMMVVVPGLLRKKSGEARQAYSQQLARYNASLQSFLGGLFVLKAYRYRDRASALLEEENQAASKAEAGIFRWHLTVCGASAFLQIAKDALILGTGAALVYRGAIQIGDLVATLQLAAIIGAPIELLSYLLHRWNEVQPLRERLEELTAEAPVRGEARRCREPFSQLEAEGLSYQTGGVEILRSVSAVFCAGEKYIISGESGSGKSTLLRLLSQVGDKGYTGSIRLNGTDARALPPEDFYQMICPVFQEPYLFRASLRENILLGRTVSEEAYRSIVEKLHLGYLLERYGGEELTPEAVEQLSGGEMQRVALARAMAGRPAAYLLDEVTSALDQSNSELVESLLLQEDAMVIHVCHKPNEALLPLYHGQFVMDGGVLAKR